MTAPTVGPDPAAIQETVDYVAVRRLQDAYADIVTRRAFAELAEIFRPDIKVRLDLRNVDPIEMNGPGEVGGWIGRALERYDFFEFVILGSRVYLQDGGDPDAAVARMYMSELRQEPNGRWTQIYGVYHDRFRRIDGRWWFAARQYHTLGRPAPDLSIYPFPEGSQFPAR